MPGARAGEALGHWLAPRKEPGQERGEGERSSLPASTPEPSALGGGKERRGRAGGLGSWLCLALVELSVCARASLSVRNWPGQSVEGAERGKNLSLPPPPFRQVPTAQLGESRSGLRRIHLPEGPLAPSA